MRLESNTGSEMNRKFNVIGLQPLEYGQWHLRSLALEPSWLTSLSDNAYVGKPRLPGDSPFIESSEWACLPAERQR